MKVEVLKPVEIEVHTVKINVKLYDDITENIPKFLLNKHGEFEIEIEVDTGKVVNWSGIESIRIYDNVCDCGTYTLFDKDGSIIVEVINDYVPNDLIPGSYGDYIDLQISMDGVVTNWPKKPDVSYFFKQDNEY